MGLLIHTADIQDRDGAVPLLASIRNLYPWLRHVFADGGYAGQKLVAAMSTLGKWTMQIVKRSDKAKDFETSIATAEACTLIASIRLMTRRLANI